MFTFNGAALRRARKPRLARIENRLTRIENRLMVNLQWGRAQTSAETSIKGWKLHVRIAYLQWGRAQTSAETRKRRGWPARWVPFNGAALRRARKRAAAAAGGGRDIRPSMGPRS